MITAPRDTRPTHGRPTVGLFGPVGSYDVGDPALLAGNLELLLPRADVRVFSYDTGRTEDVLRCMGYGDVPVMPDAGPLFGTDGLWLLNQLAYRQRARPGTLRERILFGGEAWACRRRARRIARATGLAAGDETGGAAGDETGGAAGDDATYGSFAERLAACDVVVGIGGAYLNSYWGTRIFWFEAAYALCRRLGIPYCLTGQNFGPFRAEQRRGLAELFAGAALITSRDDGGSARELAGLGVPEERVETQADSALFLTPDHDGARALRQRIGLDDDARYVVVNLHPWFYESAAASEQAAVVDFCRELIEDLGLSVVFLPMEYRTDLDFRCGLRLRESLGQIDGFHLAPTDEFFLTPQAVKGLVAGSAFVLTTRLHPMIFAMGEGRPFLALSCPQFDRLYDRKLGGAARVCGYDSERHIVAVRGLTAGKLRERFDRIDAEPGFDAARLDELRDARHDIAERILALAGAATPGVA